MIYKKNWQVRLNHASKFVTGISGECSGYGDITQTKGHMKHFALYSSSFVLRLTKREFHSRMHDRSEFAGFFGSCTSSRLYSIGLYLTIASLSSLAGSCALAAKFYKKNWGINYK